MTRQVVQDTIKSAIETGDFSALYDYLADDVELKMAMAVASPVSSERCKPSVIECLQKLGEVDMPLDHEAPEIIASGERVVAFWDEIVSLRSGVAIRVQCTLVFDVRDGLITRLAIDHDLSPVRRKLLRTDVDSARGQSTMDVHPKLVGARTPLC